MNRLINSNSLSRESNFELLRLAAMVLVVITHVDFFSLGWPSTEIALASPGTTFVKVLVESLAIVCVDVFVLISGWFGITPKRKKISTLLFQCIFFSVGLWLVDIIIKGELNGWGGV